MKMQVPTQSPARPASQARPQLPVRSDVRAGLSGDCALGVSYWRKELNNLKALAERLNC